MLRIHPSLARAREALYDAVGPIPAQDFSENKATPLMNQSPIPSRTSMLKRADQMAFAMTDERLTPEQRAQAEASYRKLTIIAEMMKRD